MFQTLVVHVLLLTHEYTYNVFASLILGILVATVPCYFCAQNETLLNLLRSVGPGRCLIVY